MSAPLKLEMVLKILCKSGDREGYEAEYDFSNPKLLFHDPGPALTFLLLVTVHVKQANCNMF